MISSKKFILASTLCAITSAVWAANPAKVTVSPAERARIEQVIHDYLLQKPEILMEASQVLQQRQMQQAENTIKSTQQNVNKFANALFKQNGDPVVGNPDGKVTIVEFFDYQCPHCVDMIPVMSEIIKNNPNVRVVFKDFPIRGPLSEFAARAGVAANLQGKYFELTHEVLTSGKPISEASILEAAQKIGLNVDKLKEDMKSKNVEDQIKNNIKLAQDLQLLGTPAFFIGKTDSKGTIVYVPGQMKQEQLQQAIANAEK